MIEEQWSSWRLAGVDHGKILTYAILACRYFNHKSERMVSYSKHPMVTLNKKKQVYMCMREGNEIIVQMVQDNVK